jgi:hypothetical protein
LPKELRREALQLASARQKLIRKQPSQYRNRRHTWKDHNVALENQLETLQQRFREITKAELETAMSEIHVKLNQIITSSEGERRNV